MPPLEEAGIVPVNVFVSLRAILLSPFAAGPDVLVAAAGLAAVIATA